MVPTLTLRGEAGVSVGCTFYLFVVNSLNFFYSACCRHGSVSNKLSRMRIYLSCADHHQCLSSHISVNKMVICVQKEQLVSLCSYCQVFFVATRFVESIGLFLLAFVTGCPSCPVSWTDEARQTHRAGLRCTDSELDKRL